jgi:hypothetical protein
VGHLVGRDGDGRALARFAAASEPVAVRVLGSIGADEIDRAIERRVPVMLGFLDGRADAPVVLGLIEGGDPPPPRPEVEVEVDGERRVIEARDELLLRCGEASILLRADGTIQIRGRDITSWARRRQRIRGGSVTLN